MSTSIQLNQAMQVALQIKKEIQDRKVDEASNLAHDLFKTAMKMVKAELSKEPLYSNDETVCPIIVDLEEALVEKGFHGHNKYLKSVSKVYRVFVELAWYQAWRISAENKFEKLKVPDELRNTLIKESQNYEKLLKKTDNVATRFELRCVRQGARRLKPTTSAWKTYLGHIANLTAASIDASASAIWEAFKGFASDLHRDNPIGWKLWYQKAHLLRWGATQVHTLQDFDKIITPHIIDCKEQGDNLSICLVKTCMDLIKRDDVEENVKEKAFNGLVDIISWERPETKKDFAKHPTEVAHKIFRRADRFWESRDLATHYLIRLARKDKYASFRERSLEALRNKRHALRETVSKRYNQEKVTLDNRLKSMQDDLSKVRKALADLEKMLIPLENKKDIYSNLLKFLQDNPAFLTQLKGHEVFSSPGYKDLKQKLLDFTQNLQGDTELTEEIRTKLEANLADIDKRLKELNRNKSFVSDETSELVALLEEQKDSMEPQCIELENDISSIHTLLEMTQVEDNLISSLLDSKE